MCWSHPSSPSTHKYTHNHKSQIPIPNNNTHVDLALGSASRSHACLVGMRDSGVQPMEIERYRLTSYSLTCSQVSQPSHKKEKKGPWKKEEKKNTLDTHCCAPTSAGCPLCTLASHQQAIKHNPHIHRHNTQSDNPLDVTRSSRVCGVVSFTGWTKRTLPHPPAPHCHLHLWKNPHRSGSLSSTLLHNSCEKRIQVRSLESK